MSARPVLLSAQDLPPRPRQRRSQAKRDRLIRAALALFGEKGYEATSIDAIAGRAGLAVGTFYQHFRSKRQLLLCLMDDLLARLGAVQLRPAPRDDGRDGRRALRGVLTVAFARDLEYLGAYRAWQEAVLADGDLKRKGVAIHQWTTARIVAVLQYLQTFPLARPRVDVAGLADVLDGFFWSLLGRATQMERIELERWIDAATHLIYHAMFTDAPAPPRMPRRRRRASN